MKNFKEIFDECIDKIFNEPSIVKDVFSIMARNADSITLQIPHLKLSYISEKLSALPITSKSVHKQTIKRIIDKLVKIEVLYPLPNNMGYSLLPIIFISGNREEPSEIPYQITNLNTIQEIDTPAQSVTEFCQKCDGIGTLNSLSYKSNSTILPSKVCQKSEESVTECVVDLYRKDTKYTNTLIYSDLVNYSKNILTSKILLHRMNSRFAGSNHKIRDINIYIIFYIVLFTTIKRDNSSKENSCVLDKSGSKIPRYSESFEKFWSAYPRKIAKRKASIRWNSQNFDKKLDIILEDLRYRFSVGEWRDKLFIPHPTTYLYQERWDDERTPLASVPAKPKFVEEELPNLRCQYSGKQNPLVASLCDEEVIPSFAESTMKTYGEILCPWHHLYIRSLANPHGFEAVKVQSRLSAAGEKTWFSDLENQ